MVQRYKLQIQLIHQSDMIFFGKYFYLLKEQGNVTWKGQSDHGMCASEEITGSLRQMERVLVWLAQSPQ